MDLRQLTVKLPFEGCQMISIDGNSLVALDGDGNRSCHISVNLKTISDLGILPIMEMPGPFRYLGLSLRIGALLI